MSRPRIRWPPHDVCSAKGFASAPTGLAVPGQQRGSELTASRAEDPRVVAVAGERDADHQPLGGHQALELVEAFDGDLKLLGPEFAGRPDLIEDLLGFDEPAAEEPQPEAAAPPAPTPPPPPAEPLPPPPPVEERTPCDIASDEVPQVGPPPVSERGGG